MQIGSFKVKVSFKWQDMWIGAYIKKVISITQEGDKVRTVVYICPIPMVCIRISRGPQSKCLMCGRPMKKCKEPKYAQN